MKAKLKSLLTAVALVTAAFSQASAISFTSDDLLGGFLKAGGPGGGASESAELGRLNTLITEYNLDQSIRSIATPGGSLFLNPGSAIPAPVLPTVSTYFKTEIVSGSTADFGSITAEWALAKFGKDSVYFHLGNKVHDGNITFVNLTGNGSGLSHATLFGTRRIEVSDSGATVLLLLLGLPALIGLRRRRL